MVKKLILNGNHDFKEVNLMSTEHIKPNEPSVHGLGDKTFQQQAKNQAAIELLKSWLENPENVQEQKETWEYLKKALDEDRLSDRKLFL